MAEINAADHEKSLQMPASLGMGDRSMPCGGGLRILGVMPRHSP